MYGSAAAYIADNSMNVLAEICGKWVISPGLCPASLPDLNILATFICGAH
jgi:hypothetical protein